MEEGNFSAIKEINKEAFTHFVETCQNAHEPTDKLRALLSSKRFQRIDDKFVQSEHLSFEDKGKVARGRKTHKFAVVSRYDQSFLGYVRWFAHWRQYVFYPLNCILNKDCLREAADYCDEATTAHKENRQSFPVNV